jgi:hypothetical protein
VDKAGAGGAAKEGLTIKVSAATIDKTHTPAPRKVGRKFVQIILFSFLFSIVFQNKRKPRVCISILTQL